MEHSYLHPKATTPLSQQIEQALPNDPELKQLWGNFRCDPSGFLSISHTGELDVDSIKAVLRVCKDLYAEALADYKLHPHGIRERNLDKAKMLRRQQQRRNSQ